MIGNISGEPFTFGQAKKLKSDTATPEDARITALRREYKTASKQDRAEIIREVQAIHDRELAGEDGKTSAARYAEKMSNTRIADVKGNRKARGGDWPEPHENKDARYDIGGMLTAEGARAMLEGDFHGGLDPVSIKRRGGNTAMEDGAPRAVGEQRIRSYERDDQGQGRSDVSADENVHIVSAVKGKNMKRGANMDGTPHSVSDRATDLEVFENLAAELKARSTAPQRALGKRLSQLVDNFIAMSPKDQARLGLATKPGMKPSDLADIINPLAEKYLKDGAAANLKDVLAKQRDYIDNPPADYTPERAKQIGEWAAKQEERLTEALKKIDEVENTDEYDRVNDLKLDARYLKEKALKVAEADSELESKLGPQGVPQTQKP